MPSKVKNKILEVLESNPEKEFNISELAERLEISHPTVSKWVAVLKAENKVEIKDYGNLKLVTLK